MQLREIKIDARERELIALLDHGDAHRGDVCYDETLHKSDLKWAEENDAYVIDKGDKFGAILHDDPRWEYEIEDPRYHGLNPPDALQKMIEDHAELYIPFVERGRYIGGIIGNHCKKLQKRHHIDLHGRFLDSIDDSGIRIGKYRRFDLGQRAIIRLKIRVTKTRILSFFIWCWHGNSYPTLRHTRMAKLERISHNYTGLHYYTMGHVHDKFFWPNISQIGVPSRGKLHLQAHRVYYGMSGTYLKGMMESHDGYPDMMSYPACELGGLRLLIDPRTLEMKEA